MPSQSKKHAPIIKQIAAPRFTTEQREGASDFLNELDEVVNNCPAHFHERLLDINTATTALEQNLKKHSLLCELLFHALFTLLFVLMFFQLLVNPNEFYLGESVKQEVVLSRFPVTRRSVVPQDSATTVWLAKQASTENFDQNRTRESRVVNATSCQSGASYCIDILTESDFTSVYSRRDFKQWMWHFLNSDVFRDDDVSITPQNFRATSSTVGAARVRQVRVPRKGPAADGMSGIDNNTCVPVHQQGCNADTTVCSDFYNGGEESTKAFGPATFSTSTQSKPSIASAQNTTRSLELAFMYRSSELLSVATLMDTSQIEVPPPPMQQKSHRSGIAYSYGGYAIDLPANRTAARFLWRSLMHVSDVSANNSTWDNGTGTYEWLDEFTAAVLVSFTLYDPSTDLLVFTLLLTEFLPTGQVLTSVDIRTFTMVSISDSVLPILTLIVVIILLLYYAREFVFSIRTDNLSAVLRSWRVLDVLTLLGALTALSIAFSMELYKSSRISRDKNELFYMITNGSYLYAPHFEPFSWYTVFVKFLVALSLMMSTVKYFKYLNIQQRFYLTLQVLRHAAKHLLAWLLLTGVSVLAFALTALFFFGSSMEPFRDFKNSIVTTSNFVFSNFDNNVDPSSPTSRRAEFSPRVSALTHYDTFQYAGRFTTMVFAQTAVWFIAFVIAFLWLFNGLIFAILAEGYVSVSKALNDSGTTNAHPSVWGLSENKKSGSRSTQSIRLQFQLMVGGLLDSLIHHSENRRVFERFVTDTDLKQRGLATYAEVKNALSDVVWVDERVDAIAFKLMENFSVPLRRLDDAVLLLHHQQQLGHDISVSLTSSPKSNLPDDLDSICTSMDSFDPLGGVKWQRDVLSCDVMTSMVYVLHRKLDAERVCIITKLLELQAQQRELTRQLYTVSAPLTRLVNAKQRLLLPPPLQQRLGKIGTAHGAGVYSHSGVDMFQHGVQQMSPNEWHVHHTSEQSVHRYIGKFATHREAARAFSRMSTQAPELDRSRKAHARRASNSTTHTATYPSPDCDDSASNKNVITNGDHVRITHMDSSGGVNDRRRSVDTSTSSTGDDSSIGDEDSEYAGGEISDADNREEVNVFESMLGWLKGVRGGTKRTGGNLKVSASSWMHQRYNAGSKGESATYYTDTDEGDGVLPDGMSWNREGTNEGSRDLPRELFRARI